MKVTKLGRELIKTAIERSADSSLEAVFSSLIDLSQEKYGHQWTRELKRRGIATTGDIKKIMAEIESGGGSL